MRVVRSQNDVEADFVARQNLASESSVKQITARLNVHDMIEVFILVLTNRYTHVVHSAMGYTSTHITFDDLEIKAKGTGEPEGSTLCIATMPSSYDSILRNFASKLDVPTEQ